MPGAKREQQERLGRALLTASGTIVHRAQQVERMARLLRSSVEDVSRREPAARVRERAEAVHAGTLQALALLLDVAIESGTLLGVALASETLDESA